MKPFKQYINEASADKAKKGDDAAYEAFFNKALKKFGAESQDELSKDKQKEFYDYVDKNWKGDNEED